MNMRIVLLTMTAIVTVPYAYTQNAMTAATPIAATAPTVVPALVLYADVAESSDGKPLTGEATATFLFFKDETGGEPLWTESQRVAFDTGGHYRVQLGASSPSGLPLTVFASGEARWLEVQIAGQKPQPRVLMSSVPYAAKAADAATLGGLPASAFVLAGSQIAATMTAAAVSPDAGSTVTTTGGTSGYVPQFTGASTVANSQIFVSSAGVGINKTSPAAMLDVNGDMIVRGSTIVARTGNATAAQGYPSNTFAFYASAYNSITRAATNPHFQIQSEPTSNDTDLPAATFNLLYTNGGTPAETGFSINRNGTLNFSPSQAFPGVVTSVGFSAPVTDFYINRSTSPTAIGIDLEWNSPPTPANTGSAIIKRDANGGFQAGAIQAGNISGNNINANAVNSYGTMFVASTLTADGPASFAKTVGIGTTTPQAELNLNAGGTANADTLLIGSNVKKGLQLRDTGSGVDIESIGAQLFVNYVTQAPTYLNPIAGPVLIHDTTDIGGGDGDTLPALVVGGNPNSSLSPILGDEPYSAHFEGDILIDGSTYTPDLRVAVDDPLDPANKTLVHSSIASSEALNQYSGNITTDELGLATVHLPDWFEAENADFRYQLTVMGERFAQAIVSKKVANNQFTISTNASHVEVSWQVTAKRNDPYAKAHPIVVEQEKSASRRGHYEHAELARDYGKLSTKKPVAVLKP